VHDQPRDGSAVERHEVVVPDGAKADSYFFKNKSVFVDHRYDFDYFVGKMKYTNLRPTKANPTYWEVGVRLRAGSPYAADILSLAEEDGIGCSIGSSETWKLLSTLGS
jgi:hypothetical protein